MRDDTILTAIDEAVGASARCDCGSELLLAEHGDALWLECPIFSSTTRLPARLALFLREATHSRRIVAALPPAPATAPVAAAQAIAATRPVVARS